MTSTQRLIEQIATTLHGGRAALLTGNIGDYHVGPEGTVIGFDQMIAFGAANAGCATVRWSPARGCQQITPPGRVPVGFNGPGPADNVNEVMRPLLDELCRSDQPVALVIDWVGDPLVGQLERVGPAAELIGTAVTDPSISAQGHRIIIVDRFGRGLDSLSPLPGTRTIEVGLPDHDERARFVASLLRSSAFSQPVLLGDDETVERIVDASNGMTLRTLASHIGECSASQQPLTRGALLPVKQEFLTQHTGGALRLITNERPLEHLAGAHNIHLMIERDRAAAATARRHLVMVGPPGTGKTTAAGAMGRAMGRTAVALGNIRSQWVGESERLTRRAIAAAESMSPSLVFIDEIDQIISGDDGPSGDSGVTQRINAMLWEWTGSVEHDDAVLVVGATNRPEALGERALDRFTVVPVLHPDPYEAIDVVRITAARSGVTVDSDAVANLVRASLTPVSGRTLAELVHRAQYLAAVADGVAPTHLDGSMMQHALGEMIGGTTGERERQMALQAIRFTRHRSMLPWAAAVERGRPYELPSYLHQFVFDDGTPDVDGIERYLSEVGP